jgi:hypothetical protein
MCKGKNSDTIKNHPLLRQLSNFNNDELDDILHRTVKIIIFITVDTMCGHIPSEDLTPFGVSNAESNVAF